ncbi:uncharacterized protein C8Q71DRAFT_671818, partial [Rhodofomes roseus]
MMDSMVSHESKGDIPAYIRVAKPLMPTPWEGADDLYAFEEWLQRLLSYFQTLKITGPSMDSDRLRLLGSAIKGDAYTWYFRHVQSPRRERWDWTFNEAILALHRRFIHSDGEVQAAMDWDSVNYNRKGGINELLDRMTKYGDRMTQRPSEYAWKCKFLEALPAEMRHTLENVYIMTPERTPYPELVAVALKLERAAQSSKARAARGNKSTVTTAKTGSGMDGQSASAPNTGKATSGGYSAARNRRPAKPQTDGPTATSNRQSTAQSTKPAMDGAASATRPLARRKIICWTCGGEGHTSRDKACPDYGKPPSKNPQMHAGRIVDEDAKSVASSSTTTASKGQGHVDHTAAHLDQVDDEGQDSYPRSDYGGLQYASDGDQADSPFEE